MGADKDPIRNAPRFLPSITMSNPTTVKWLPRFKRELETCVKTIPSGDASEERENVLAWAADYVKVKVRGAKANLWYGPLKACARWTKIS